jgi:hypothetical protein
MLLSPRSGPPYLALDHRLLATPFPPNYHPTIPLSTTPILTHALSSAYTVPGPAYGAPTLTELRVPEQAESVIASILHASSESAAQLADNIGDIFHGAKEEIKKQI